MDLDVVSEPSEALEVINLLGIAGESRALEFDEERAATWHPEDPVHDTGVAKQLQLAGLDAQPEPH